MAELRLIDFKPLTNVCFLVCIFIMLLVKTPSCSVVSTGQEVDIDPTGSANGPHHCTNAMCCVCHHFEVNRISLNNTVCVNVTYLSKEYGIQLTTTIGKRMILSKTVSATNPPPFCAGVPYVEIFPSLCVKLYNISYTVDHFKTCVNISVRFFTFSFLSLKLGCFGVPSTNYPNPNV